MALYNTPFGQSEIGGTTRTNAMGQKVYTSGNVYDSQGNIMTLTPINSSTLPGWYTTGGNSGGSYSSGISYGGGSGGGGSGGINLSSTRDVKSAAQSSFQSAIDTALGGVDSARNAVAKSQGHITNTQLDLDAARKAAGGIGTAITNVNNSALSLNPFIKSLQDQGDSQLSLYEQLMSGNAVSGSAADNYLKAVGLAGDAALNITPDRYVSMAASDVQSSFDNAQGQFQRNLARQGIDAGSGAGLEAVRKQLTQSLATALAAEKTKARQVGINDQLTALTNRAGLYKDVLNQAQAAQQQGTQTLAQAAGIVQAQGDMFATAGSLASQQVNSFANIGGVEVNLGQLELQNENLVQDALDNVRAAQQAMAQFYLELAGGTTRRSSTTVKSDGTGSYTNTSQYKYGMF